MYGTHFIFNMDDSKTIGLRGSENWNYADVVGGADGFRLVLRSRRGRNAKLLNLFIIFKNRDLSYSMIKLSDNIPNISYRTQQQDWMYNIAFNAWLEEPLGTNMDEMNRTRRLFENNCQRHKLTEPVRSAMEVISTIGSI